MNNSHTNHVASTLIIFCLTECTVIVKNAMLEDAYVRIKVLKYWDWADFINGTMVIAVLC